MSSYQYRWLNYLFIFTYFLLTACSPLRKDSAETNQFDKYKPPFRVFSVGQWANDKVVLTLTDSQGIYFTALVHNSAIIKKGQLYAPAVTK